MTKLELEKELTKLSIEEYEFYSGDIVTIDKSVISNVFKLTDGLGHKCVEVLDDIMPTPNSTIVLDWDSSDNVVSVEVGTKNMSYYIKGKDNEPEFFNHVEINDESIRELKKYIIV